MASTMPSDMSADVVVVGAGPGGSSTAYHLARAGLDVVLLEKSPFPRDKVCGDGLTPAAVHELIAMGVDTTGWMRNRGLTVIGVTAKSGRGKDATTTTTVRASITVDAGGVAARLATSLGLEKKMNRPMGVAARAYFHSPRGDEEWMESHLELWSGTPGASDLLPGYGWIFPMGDGIVNVGLGSVASRAGATNLPYREVFKTWTANLPEEWGFTPENQIGQLRSAALPMSFNRKPHYVQGLVLVGDAGGMVSPYNGEGIAPAMKAGRYAASCIAQALARSHRAGIDRAMSEYPHMLRDEYGGYYQLGRIFVALIENPTIMRTCTNVGLPIPRLMTLVHKLLSDGYERSGGDFDDQLITMLTKVVRPA